MDCGLDPLKGNDTDASFSKAIRMGHARISVVFACDLLSESSRLTLARAVCTTGLLGLGNSNKSSPSPYIALNASYMKP